MGNILNFNVNKIDMRLSNHDYWDLYLAKGDYSIVPSDTILSGDCLVAHFDFNNNDIYSDGITGNTILSLSSSTWNNAVNTGYTLSTIGLTGLDNGLIPYTKISGDPSNEVLVSALTGTTLVIPSGETRLMLNRVSGYTGNFTYPLNIISEPNSLIGNFSRLCGGFYQGYYKLDGYSYEVLPNRVPKSWTAELWLRKSSGIEPITGLTEFTNIPLYKPAFSPFVVVTIVNHGLSIDDSIIVTGTTNDTEFSLGVGVVYDVLNANEFRYEMNTIASEIQIGTGSVLFNIENNNCISEPEEPKYFDVRTSEQSGSITGILVNHGLNVGDVISVSGSPIDMVNTDLNYSIMFAVVGSVYDENTFSYGSGKTPLPFTLTTYGYLSKYVIDFIEDDVPLNVQVIGFNRFVSLTGLTINKPIFIDNISSNVGRFTPWNINQLTDPYLIGYTSTFGYVDDNEISSGFTYSNNSLASPPLSATGRVTVYKLKEKQKLNDVYTGNTGFFLYFGTRAENKFWNVFDGVNTGATSGCTSGATDWCTIPKETDVSFIDNSGNTINLSPPPIDYTETDNGFLIYSRANNNRRCGSCGADEHREGYTVCTFTGSSIFIGKTREIITDDRNPFLVYSRARSGTTDCGNVTHPAGENACTFSGFTSPQLELDKDADLIDNALGFRIREDGSIGYRKLIVTATCVNDVTVTGCTIEESYSESGLVSNDQWHMISIRFVADTTLDECELEWKPARKGKLMFYINGKLKFIVDDFDEFIARRLLEHKDKQLAVPYNISLGGGTIGLNEEMTFDGPDDKDLGSCLDENFGGTFIGDISQFRFYICCMDYCNINNNFNQERVRYLGN